MSKPLVVPNWASDANYTSGDESGQSTRLQPASGIRAQGFIPKQAAPARWMNWLAGTLCDWASYLNGLTTDPDFVGSNFTWTGDHTFDTGTLSTFDGDVEVNGTLTVNAVQVALDGLYVDNHIGINGELLYANAPLTNTPLARTVVLPMSDGTLGAGSTGEASATTGFFLSSGTVFYSLKVPRGATLNELKVHVRNTSGGSASVTCSLDTVAPDFVTAGTTPTITSLATSTQSVATGTGYIFTFGSLAHTVDNSVRWLRFSVQTTASISIMGGRINFDDPGPRNG